MKKVCALIGKYFGVIAVIFLIIGRTLPTSFSWVLGKVGGISVLSVLLGVIMFGMGMTMSVHDFALVLKRPKDVFFGACAQYFVMPFLAYVLSTIFQLDPALSRRPWGVMTFSISRAPWTLRLLSFLGPFTAWASFPSASSSSSIRAFSICWRPSSCPS